MKFLLSLAVLLSFSCGRDINKLDLIIEPKKPGWYFVEIKHVDQVSDSATARVNMRFANTLYQAKIKNIDDINISAHDFKGVDLRDRLKYLSIRYHNNHHNYVSVYNPTDQQLAEIDKWNPTNSDAFEISLESNRILDSLLSR